MFKKLITFVKNKPDHVLRYALDLSKIKKKLGWQPKVSFEDGLRRTVEWYLNHQDWVENVISGEYANQARKYMAARHK